MADDDATDRDGEPLKPFELKYLRRMMEDDIYRRRVKTTVKVWVYTLGTVAAAVTASLTIWKELVARFWK